MVNCNDDREYIDGQVAALKKSLVFFSNKCKPSRERWVVNELLEYMQIETPSDEIRFSQDEPPDIVFRDYRFEIKEILDNGRKRTEEYKASLSKAEKANDASSLLEHYTPNKLPIESALVLALSKTEQWSVKYSTSARQNLDLLIYLNLRGTTIVGSELPSTIVLKIAEFGWRSFSFVSNNNALIVAATTKAPSFLQSLVGKILVKKNRTSS